MGLGGGGGVDGFPEGSGVPQNPQNRAPASTGFLQEGHSVGEGSGRGAELRGEGAAGEGAGGGVAGRTGGAGAAAGGGGSTRGGGDGFEGA